MFQLHSNQLLLVCILGVIAVRAIVDFIIYKCHSGPAHAHVTPIGWLFGWLCAAVVTYWFLNGQQF